MAGLTYNKQASHGISHVMLSFHIKEDEHNAAWKTLYRETSHMVCLIVKYGKGV